MKGNKQQPDGPSETEVLLPRYIPVDALDAPTRDACPLAATGRGSSRQESAKEKEKEKQSSHASHLGRQLKRPATRGGGSRGLMGCCHDGLQATVPYQEINIQVAQLAGGSWSAVTVSAASRCSVWNTCWGLLHKRKDDG